MQYANERPAPEWVDRPSKARLAAEHSEHSGAAQRRQVRALEPAASARREFGEPLLTSAANLSRRVAHG